jgi:hypothetical protein
MDLWGQVCIKTTTVSLLALNRKQIDNNFTTCVSFFTGMKQKTNRQLFCNLCPTALGCLYTIHIFFHKAAV